MAGGAMGDGGAGTIGHRQGPQQDERQEQHQAAGAQRSARGTVPLGRRTDWPEERAQGRGLLLGWCATYHRRLAAGDRGQTGRASLRERVVQYVYISGVGVPLKKKKN